MPGFLFALPAGYTADRLPKRFVVVLSSIAHFLVICLAPLLFRLLPEIFACPLVLGLIFTVQTFFIPAFYALLPEIFTEDELSRANGTLNFWQFAGFFFFSGDGAGKDCTRGKVAKKNRFKKGGGHCTASE